MISPMRPLPSTASCKPSILQVRGCGRDRSKVLFPVQTTCRVGGSASWFGNGTLVAALAKIQILPGLRYVHADPVAAIAALEDRRIAWSRSADVPESPRRVVRRPQRDGLEGKKPRATMFVWAPIPEPYKQMGSLGVLQEAAARCEGGGVARHRFRLTVTTMCASD